MGKKKFKVITTDSIRAIQGSVVNYLEGQFKKDVKGLSPKERMNFYFKLIPYVLPRVKPTESNIVNSRQSEYTEFELHIMELAAKCSPHKNKAINEDGVYNTGDDSIVV